MNNLRNINESKCSICGRDNISVYRDSHRRVWVVTCNFCGCFREFPAEDPDSNIVEPGELTKEEAMNRYEDLGTKSLDKVYGEGKREL